MMEQESHRMTGTIPGFLKREAIGPASRMLKRQKRDAVAMAIQNAESR
jgi:hypothetical protein